MVNIDEWNCLLPPNFETYHFTTQKRDLYKSSGSLVCHFHLRRICKLSNCVHLFLQTFGTKIFLQPPIQKYFLTKKNLLSTDLNFSNIFFDKKLRKSGKKIKTFHPNQNSVPSLKLT